MSKNIIEFLEDHIREYEPTGKELQNEIMRSLVQKKGLLIRTMTFDYLYGLLALHSKSNKRFEEKLSEQYADSKIDQRIKFLESQSGRKGFLDLYLEFVLEQIDCCESVFRNTPSKTNRSIKEVHQKYIEIIKLIFSEKYSGPDHPVDLFAQTISISVLYFIFAHLEPIPLTLLQKIDAVMIQLVFALGILIQENEKIGLRNYRIARARSMKRKTKADRKQPVLEAYYRIRTDERQKMSKNKIATTIRKDLDKMLREPPSLSSIKRYLKEENLI